jgi:hypothetical protein
LLRAFSGGVHSFPGWLGTYRFRSEGNTTHPLLPFE